MASDPFRERVVLLTGASRGLGLALARGLAARGARLVLSSRTPDDLRAAGASLPDPSAVTTIPADLSLPGEAERLAAAALAARGRVDLLINNAGFGYFALLREVDGATLRRLFEVNAFAPLLLARALLPALLQAGGGRVVNVVSSAAFSALPAAGAYGASKAALGVLGRVLRLELEPAGIEVVNVYPGTLDTEFEARSEREGGRAGFFPGGGGRPALAVAEEVLAAAAGPAGDVWLDESGRQLAIEALARPAEAARRLAPLRDRVLCQGSGAKPHAERIWKRWRLEAALLCNLRCALCPGQEARAKLPAGEGLMQEEVFAALRPLLGEVAEVDFSGGGEPLVNPRLCEWLAEARAAGASASFQTNGAALDAALCERIVAAGADRVILTTPGASADSFRRGRPGIDFEAWRAHVLCLAAARRGRKLEIVLRCVMQRERAAELEEMVELAAQLGADGVDFTHCDVVQELPSGRPGLFAAPADARVRELEKALRRARKRARKLGLEVRATSFVPEEQAVCAHDPRQCLFVRHDGSVAPCQNLGIGGNVCFLGADAELPVTHYGRLDGSSLLDLWRSPACRAVRERFAARAAAQEEATAGALFPFSLRRLSETLEAARAAMPEPPPGCGSCRHLYDL